MLIEDKERTGVQTLGINVCKWHDMGQLIASLYYNHTILHHNRQHGKMQHYKMAFGTLSGQQILTLNTP